MSVTYQPTSRPCWDAQPPFRGSRVRPDALELHASCDGTYRGGPLGPYRDGDPCQCECHTPAGLPGWMKPQEGEALEAAIALDARIRARTEELRRRHPVPGPGRLMEIARILEN